MKELIFRQPRIANGKFNHWHYWGYVDGGTGHFVSPLPPNTGGDSYQFTGLLDRVGKRIFEGDIVVCDDDGEYFPQEYIEATDEYVPCGKYEVVWADHCAWWLRDEKEEIDIEYSPFGYVEMEIIGNKFQNPELQNDKP